MNPSDWRNTMGKFATGVTVITGLDADNEPFGMTANAFTSVSLDPSLLLICVDNKSSILKGITDTKKFCVNILSASQKEISRRFAQKGLEDRFSGVDYHISDHGVPILDGCLANIECATYKIVEGGDHYIFIGEGLTIHNNENEQLPLVFYKGKYKAISDEEPQVIGG